MMLAVHTHCSLRRYVAGLCLNVTYMSCVAWLVTVVCPTGCCYFMVLQIYEPLNNKSHNDMLRYTTTARGLRRGSSVGISSVFSILPPIHVIRITYPDHLQNLIYCSLARNIPLFSCKSAHYFLSNQTDRQTDKRDTSTNKTKNITFRVELKNDELFDPMSIYYKLFDYFQWLSFGFEIT